MWNKDELKGKTDKAKGKIKESIGHLTDDERLREEGAQDQGAGTVEETVGKGRRKVGETVEDLGDSIKK